MDQKTWPKAAIVILNWNGWVDTVECMESVRQLNYPDYLTIVVDNGSWDDSVQKIKAWTSECMDVEYALIEYDKPFALKGGDEAKEEILEATPPKAKMVLIRSEENLGFTGGNNLAIQYSLSKKYPVDYVFFLNNDAKVDRGCLNHLISVARESNAGITGAVVMDQSGGKVQFAKSGSFFRHSFISLIRNQKVPKTEARFWPSFLVYGAAMLIRRDLLNNVYRSRGYYWNPDLFAYGDELEFCFNAFKAGYKSVVARNAVVYHGKRSQSNRQYNPRFFHYYATRNQLLLAKSFPLSRKILFHIIYLPLCLRRILKLTILYKTYVAKAIIFGLVDGYRGITGKWKYHDREELICRDLK